MALQDLLPEQFERGLIRCRDECEWPPSIATFRKFATGADEHWEHRGPAYKQTIQALPKPKANVENVREQLAAMRQALNNR